MFQVLWKYHDENGRLENLIDGKSN
jgi:hypothetical protein